MSGLISIRCRVPSPRYLPCCVHTFVISARRLRPYFCGRRAKEFLIDGTTTKRTTLTIAEAVAEMV